MSRRPRSFASSGPGPKEAVLLLALAGCGGEESFVPGSRFAIAVVAFEPGEQAGFGQDRMPDVVLGPPRGTGVAVGSTDVVSLGVGGSIVVELGVAAVDGDGPARARRHPAG